MGYGVRGTALNWEAYFSVLNQRGEEAGDLPVVPICGNSVFKMQGMGFLSWTKHLMALPL